MDVKQTIQERVEWIKNLLKETGAKGIIYGNSGGKDCTLVAALSKLATDNVLGVIMPCESKRNYGSDKDDAVIAGEKFGIPQIVVDLTETKQALMSAIGDEIGKDVVSEYAGKMAPANANPRLRMTVLYSLGQAKGYLVAGTGNLCEMTMGYFTKWGDGACDFNPIADLTVPEVYALLRELDAPKSIIDKEPSAGLYEGQTDEKDMGVTYSAITAYCRGGEIDEVDRQKIDRTYKATAHKRSMPRYFPNQAQIS